MLQQLIQERADVREAMVFALEHTESATEVRHLCEQTSQAGGRREMCSATNFEDMLRLLTQECADVREAALSALSDVQCCRGELQCAAVQARIIKCCPYSQNQQHI